MDGEGREGVEVKKSSGYGSSGSAFSTVNGGNVRINKQQGNKRYGMAFTLVRRADGTLGHKYGDKPIVWLKPKKGLSGP